VYVGHNDILDKKAKIRGLNMRLECFNFGSLPFWVPKAVERSFDFAFSNKTNECTSQTSTAKTVCYRSKDLYLAKCLVHHHA
jgi:hypothetical protein